jgi:hypothetical protein
MVSAAGAAAILKPAVKRTSARAVVVRKRVSRDLLDGSAGSAAGDEVDEVADVDCPLVPTVLSALINILRVLLYTRALLIPVAKSLRNGVKKTC